MFYLVFNKCFHYFAAFVSVQLMFESNRRLLYFNSSLCNAILDSLSLSSSFRASRNATSTISLNSIVSCLTFSSRLNSIYFYYFSLKRGALFYFDGRRGTRGTHFFWHSIAPTNSPWRGTNFRVKFYFSSKK